MKAAKKIYLNFFKAYLRLLIRILLSLIIFLRWLIHHQIKIGFYGGLYLIVSLNSNSGQ